MTAANFLKPAFLYITTNKVNSRIYMGVRTYKYNKEDHTYLGSGIAIKSAIAKYGEENFSREIILIATASYCYDIERKIVNEEWVKSTDNYNTAVGGWGGSRGKEAKEKMILSKKKHFLSLPKEEQERRLEQIRKLQPTKDQHARGKDAAKWNGYWITPAGEFETCRSAALANNIDHRTLRSRCKINNLKAIKKPNRRHRVPKSWVGKTWKELGWGFSHKEVQGVK